MKSRLLELVQLVAAAPATQIAAFPGFAEVADEIAIELGELALALERDPDAAVSAGERAIVVELDALLSAWSGPDHLEVWTLPALETHEVWLETRARARRWLLDNKYALRAPRLDWLNFVQ